MLRLRIPSSSLPMPTFNLVGIAVGVLKNPPAQINQLVEDLANADALGRYDYLLNRHWNDAEPEITIYAFVRDGVPPLKEPTKQLEQDLPFIRMFVEGWLVGRESRSRH